MTWAEQKLLIVNRLKFDGASSHDLNSTAISSAFDLRAKIAVQEFVRETFYIYEDRAALTLALNDRIVNLLDGAKCAKPIFNPRLVWVNNAKLSIMSPDHQELLYASATVSTGAPTTWCMPQEGIIKFENKCAAGYADSYVSGWAKHPDISADNQALAVNDWHANMLAAYVAAQFATPVVSSQAGVNRLQMYDKEAYDGMVQLKAANLARFFGSGDLG